MEQISAKLDDMISFEPSDQEKIPAESSSKSKKKSNGKEKLENFEERV